LEDLGYEVDLSAADQFSPPSSASFAEEWVADSLYTSGDAPWLVPLPVSEERQILVETPWRNHTLAADVNGDGQVSPLDALHVINDLNASGSRALPTSRAMSNLFVDVSGDNFLSALDALMVINALNELNATPAGRVAEGSDPNSDTRDGSTNGGDENSPTVAVESYDAVFADVIGIPNDRTQRPTDRPAGLQKELVDALLGGDSEFQPLLLD
jgi:hypothetical protein